MRLLKRTYESYEQKHEKSTSNTPLNTSMATPMNISLSAPITKDKVKKVMFDNSQFTGKARKVSKEMDICEHSSYEVLHHIMALQGELENQKPNFMRGKEVVLFMKLQNQSKSLRFHSSKLPNQNISQPILYLKKNTKNDQRQSLKFDLVKSQNNKARNSRSYVFDENKMCEFVELKLSSEQDEMRQQLLMSDNLQFPLKLFQEFTMESKQYEEQEGQDKENIFRVEEDHQQSIDHSQQQDFESHLHEMSYCFIANCDRCRTKCEENEVFQASSQRTNHNQRRCSTIEEVTEPTNTFSMSYAPENKAKGAFLNNENDLKQSNLSNHQHRNEQQLKANSQMKEPFFHIQQKSQRLFDFNQQNRYNTRSKAKNY